MRGRRSHRVGAALLGVALVLSGCGVFSGEDPGEVAGEFLDAFARGDTAAAAELTDDPGAARRLFDGVRAELEPESVTTTLGTVREAEGTTYADYRVEWDLGQGRTFGYDTRAALTTDGDTAIRFRPSLVHPELQRGQTLALRSEDAAPVPVHDRDGAPLLRSDEVVNVLLHRDEAGEQADAVIGSLAGALNPLDDRITPSSIESGVSETEEGAPYLVASLRSSDYATVKEDIHELPGVRFTTRHRMLPVTRGLGERILPAVREVARERSADNAGWSVAVVDSDGAEVGAVHRVQPEAAEPLRSTLSLPVQQEAERALDAADSPGVLVALEPSSGDLLAVAANNAAVENGTAPLTGRYPPGSTFKIATAAAALRAGTGVDTPVECPATTVIDGREIPNDDEFDLGTVPLRQAFARSCNTTFAHLALELPDGALTDAARSLGIGADYVIPGVTTVTGSAEPGDGTVARASAGFGQGTMLASPFGTALMSATVAAGKTPVPGLLTDRETEVTVSGEPLPEPVLAGLRTMMRAVVTDGTATELNDGLSGVHGKTGTAQYGDGTEAHGWFTGYRDDLAFAVLLEGAGSSKPAVATTRDFLTGLG
ncbi:penicillin-binding transpeptidase domain-containing protein [Saccharomonospora iraqiensis]|uniref:penicillin-binding transpeptidase domain-containing protein n=1 Tax=Saccharomonospora iraqiensis TaxID=52698 RepID=UPI000409BCF4|nr:penicillin-binding transpeptidase domain-containing protein [Saccharomonospora iraqiensis]